MNREKPVLVLTDNDRIRGMIKSVVRPRLEVICVSTLSGTVLPMTRGQISLVIVDLASRAMSGDDLMAIARVSEGRNVPLILMTRQPRQAVKPLASVINARDVISMTDSEMMIAARLRMWLGIDPDTETLPLGFTAVMGAHAVAS